LTSRPPPSPRAMARCIPSFRRLGGVWLCCLSPAVMQRTPATHEFATGGRNKPRPRWQRRFTFAVTFA
jgi:hypothetical protein